MKKGEGLYYKIARPDGWDFYTGSTINYRDALGKTVVVPNPTMLPADLCSPGVLHASRLAEDCFQGGHIPCSLYRVQGTPIISDDTKAGFLKMDVLQEIDPAVHFKWRYAEAANPMNLLLLPVPQVTPEDIALLAAWASVRGSVWASVGDSVGDSVWDSVCAYTGWIFAPVIPKWRVEYPYQSAVDLWRRGLVPSYDGRVWRLHAGPSTQIVYAKTL